MTSRDANGNRAAPYTLEELEVLTFQDAQNPLDLVMAIRSLAREVKRVNDRLDAFRGVSS